jgi:hypothetical protein
MRKKYILLLLLTFSAFVASAQIQLGFKASPYWSSNRVNIGSSTDVSNDGNALRFTLGPVADISINGNDSYFFSTGLWFSARRAGISYLNDNSERITQSYNLQYLSVPVTMKLYTQEVLLDKRIYFQFGPTIDIKISDKLKEGDPDNQLVEKFRFIDLSLFMSAGMDWYMGGTTRIYGGLTYSRGLINAASKTIEPLNDMSYKNDLFGIELGVMF